ncbi:MAG TPA: aspartate--tRNA ligase [Methylomirabilota bacterium]|jgi:aspartyl-tRNA synthetase|nr:aspartate--tRNA ligase [Methylomirabilota bacterium]
MSQAFRSHTCGELRASHVGERVTLSGWVHRRRDHGHLAFFDLRDRYGITQAVTNADDAADAHAAAEPARNEWVVQVEGVVRHRPDGTTNAELATGEIEVAVDAFTVLNASKVPPFYVNEEQPGLDESLRLAYRYLDLRRPPLQQRMLLRSRLSSAVRRSLEAVGFVDIETPTLIRSTPEGARDFVVPSRVQPGKFFALPQSPQQLKQLLMVAGYDRYYQLARAYRDEDLRGDRQLEHTQIDIEMSFVAAEDVMATVEGMVTAVSREVLPDRPIMQTPFPRLTYEDAMHRYGSDKPDLRFGMELVDLGSAIEGVDFRIFTEALAAGGAVFAIRAPGCGGYTRRQLDELTDLAQRHGAKGLVHLSVEPDGSLHGPIAKFLSPPQAAAIRDAAGAEPGDLILAAADADSLVAANAIGYLRLEMGERLELRDPNVLAYVWVFPFPMFNWDAEQNRWDATHNPFSAPVWAEESMMETDPGAVHAQQYDLAMNGWELGGGSIRIHRRDLLERAFALMGHSVEGMRDQFGALLDALEYGAPPHGGIAIGLDRWSALLAGQDNIREVMAFPKTQSGSDLMMGAPSPITAQQLDELSLRVEKR